mmetsp:Transcript_4436/g.10967  ORF Transcript_4436/g.10967 Transcript_4436/m.10967 type:complete len:270 (+) Transcript_4436:471-1280(+)
MWPSTSHQAGRKDCRPPDTMSGDTSAMRPSTMAMFSLRVGRRTLESRWSAIWMDCGKKGRHASGSRSMISEYAQHALLHVFRCTGSMFLMRMEMSCSRIGRRWAQQHLAISPTSANAHCRTLWSESVAHAPMTGMRLALPTSCSNAASSDSARPPMRSSAHMMRSLDSGTAVSLCSAICWLCSVASMMFTQRTYTTGAKDAQSGPSASTMAVKHSSSGQRLWSSGLQPVKRSMRGGSSTSMNCGSRRLCFTASAMDEIASYSDARLPAW